MTLESNMTFNLPNIPPRNTKEFNEYAARVMLSGGPYLFKDKDDTCALQIGNPVWDWRDGDYYIKSECLAPIELPLDVKGGDTLVTNTGVEITVMESRSQVHEGYVRTTPVEGLDLWRRTGPARNLSSPTTHWIVEHRSTCPGIVSLEGVHAAGALVTNKGHHLNVLQIRKDGVATDPVPNTCRDLWLYDGKNAGDKSLWIVSVLAPPITIPSNIKRGDILIAHNGERLKVLTPEYVHHTGFVCVYTTTMANGVANLWTLDGKNAERPDSFWITGFEEGKLRWYTPEEGMQLIFDWPDRFIVRNKNKPDLWWTSIVAADHSSVHISAGAVIIDEGNFANYQYTHDGETWADFGAV